MHMKVKTPTRQEYMAAIENEGMGGEATMEE